MFKRKMCSVPTFLKILAMTITLYGMMELYTWSTKEYGNAGSLNYFLDEKESNRGYLIDTPKCKILNMSAWDDAILPFITTNLTPPDCTKGAKGWAYILDKTIYINHTALKNSGYSQSSIRCCYKVILRVEQTLDKFDWGADNQVKYSETCFPIELISGTVLQHEFIRVFCTSTSWPYFGDIVYRQFFAVAIAHKQSTLSKLEYWAQSGRPIPPSVLILGVDAISRHNYHRSFPLTKKFLDGIGAVEFLGYTKVAENTYPNTVPFLAGYESSQLENTCIQNSSIPQDSCPYIWKRFSASNYLTATVEDSPGLVGFNYLRLGFVQQPTDFYFRPFMLAVHKSLLRNDYYHTDCIGSLTTEQTLLNYLQGIMSYSTQAPVFVHTWMTSLAHLNINRAKFGDPTISSFLSSLPLSNTILIFLSDHGQRYGPIRETLAGWYEDKLPILSIYLPPTLRKTLPQWYPALQLNSLRLTSPFDLYQMMDQILHQFSNNSDPLRTYGKSLFTEIPPTRSCSEAGIKVNYCACVPPKKIDAADPTLLQGAAAALTYLNKQVPSQCAQAELDRVVAGALMENEDGHSGTYIVSFSTMPGHFLFEATVDFTRGKDLLNTRVFNVTSDLLRMNKITRSASCVNTSLLERYCYCK